MRDSPTALRAFLDGFSVAGLFGWAKLPGGAETLVEETTDLSESQFAELFLPFSKMEANSGVRSGNWKKQHLGAETPIYIDPENGRSETAEPATRRVSLEHGKYMIVEESNPQSRTGKSGLLER